MNTKTKIITLVLLACLGLPAFSQIATVPYSEDFNSGALGPEWTLFNSDPLGRIQFTTNGSVSPLSGGNAMVMDVSTSGTYVTNTGTLLVDLAPTGGGVLKYWFKETSDENHTEDGVFLSDGVTTVLLQSHQSGPSAWTEYSIDLTAVAAANGIALTNPLQIIFSHYDNFPVPTDGFFYDDVRVFPPPVPDTGQANSAQATLLVGNGLNLNGQPPGPGINGPYFASGNSLEITVMGEPNAPWILMLGPLNRNNLVLPSLGSLDIGMLGPGSIADIAFIMNGTAPVTFLDQLAVTDPTGVSNLSFGLGPVPTGLLGTFQAAVLHAGGTQIKFSAAFEFTVTP